MDRHTGYDHRKREGRALRPPSTPPTTNGTRVVTPCPACGRNDNDREGPDLQGTTKGGSNPQQPPTTTDTELHAGEPLLHLGHEIGSHMSTRPAEVANHHKPPPTCTGNGLRNQTLPRHLVMER
jgi:hypothetical protein